MKINYVMLLNASTLVNQTCTKSWLVLRQPKVIFGCFMVFMDFLMLSCIFISSVSFFRIVMHYEIFDLD